MPHLAEEAHIMMGNLIPYLWLKYKVSVLDYFREEDRLDAKDDIWDDVNKCVICTTDTNMDIEDKDNGIVLDEATKFLEAEKASRKQENAPKATWSDPKAQLEKWKEAAAQLDAMVNKSERAYYKDDDSLSTWGGTLGENTIGTTGKAGFPISVDTQSVTDSTGSPSQASNKDTQVVLDDTSMASMLTFQSLKKIESRLNENDEWKKEHQLWKQQNDKMMKDILSFVSLGKAADTRPSTQTDAVASLSGGGGL